MNPSQARWAVPLFATALFGSAALIFVVQPLVAKRILPWFGGAPAVWMLCLAFFQTALFAGYAYAHALQRLAPAGRQWLVHAGVVALALLTLPVLPSEAWRPVEAGGAPSVAILAMLGANVAAPFLALAAAGPLLQAWFARVFPERSPYPLYAVSNLGSLIGVAAYPFWIEPRLGVGATGAAWSLGFGLTAAATIACAWIARRGAGPAASPAEATQAPGPGAILLWMLLAGTAVMLLMGTTNRLCRDVASVPFLWMLPLGIYLVTLVICFGSESLYRRAVFGGLALAALASFLLPGSLFSDAELALGRLRWSIAQHGLMLFAACMLLHGELYRLRPAPQALTLFYLCVSAGGALGGLFVGIAAPRLFDDYSEVPIAAALCALGLFASLLADENGWIGRGAPAWRKSVVGAAGLVGLVLALASGAERPALHQERSFFGVLRVEERALPPGPEVRLLSHGSIYHGFQSRMRQDLPSSYFCQHTGFGLIFADRPREPSMRVGVLGLGIGTIAAYGRATDRFRFYEVDPGVIRLARSHFSYLDRSAAEIEIVEGDGRLSLEAEQRNEEPRFDLLVLDAYSGDAMPVHLMTREAMALYVDRIRERGLLAFNVTNVYFDLAPLVARLGSELGLEAVVLQNAPARRRLCAAASWVLLSSDAARLEDLARRAEERWRSLGLLDAERTEVRRLDPETLARVAPWTDDYSDLFGALRPAAERDSAAR